MEASISEIVFRVIWVVSSIGAILIAALGLTGSRGYHEENDIFPGIDPVVFVGVAGFCAFPLINTGICVFFLVHLFIVVPNKRERQAKRQKETHIVNLSFTDAYERILNESRKK